MTSDLKETKHASQEKATITLVAPNGKRSEERYHRNEKVSHVLLEAVREFGRTGDLDPTGTYILVRDQTPLPEDRTLEDVGVRDGDVLKIRSRQIPGDG
jgi:hypothetical protein